MSEENKKSAEIVFDEEDICRVIAKMEMLFAFPKNKKISNWIDPLSYVKGKDKIIIDLNKRKFKCFFYCNDFGNGIYYCEYTFDLDNVDFNVFFIAIFTELKISEFRIAMRKIFENDYLRKKFYDALENSIGLRKVIFKKLNHFVEIARDYDTLLVAKLLI